MQWRVLAAIWLSAFLVSLDYTAVNVALPTLASEFNAGTSAVSWVALSYMLVVVALTLPAGAAINRLGYRTVLTWSLSLFALASLASGLTSDLWSLVAMRAVQGIGASIMFAIGPAMIKTMFASETQSRAFAIFSTGPTAGLCAGPAIGGLLSERFGWQAIFMFSLAAAVLAIALLRIAPQAVPHQGTPAPHAVARTAHPLIVGLAFAALLTLLLGLNQGHEWGWQSPRIVLLFVASVAILLVLVLIERRALAPLIGRELLAAAGFVTAGAILFPLLVVFGGTVFLVPFYFEWLLKADTGLVGRVLMVQPIATIAVSSLAAFCFTATGRRTLCRAGIVLFTLGVAALALADRDASLAIPIAALSLMGAGMGLYYPTMIELSMADVPDHLAASASGLQATGRSLAQLLGVVLFETAFAGLFPMALHGELAAAASGMDLVNMQSAFRAVFWFGTAIAAVALLPSFLVGNAKSVGEKT